MTSTDRSWLSRGNANDTLNLLHAEVSNLREKPFLAIQPADSENQNPSYNREEQNAFIEVGAFARRYLREIRAARLKAKIDAVPEPQEAGEDGNDGTLEISDQLKMALESVAALSEKSATDCLRLGRSALSVQKLRRELQKTERLAREEMGRVSIVNKDEIQQQQGRENFDSQNDQDEKQLATGQDQLPRTLQARKRQMSLLSPEQHQRPSKRRSKETLLTADDKTQ